MNASQTYTSIVRVLQDSNRGLSARYTASRVGVSETTARNYLREMVANGDVVVNGKIGRGAARYAPSPKRATRYESRPTTHANMTAEAAEANDDANATREAYRAIRYRAVYASDTHPSYTGQDFDLACRELLGDDISPAAWVKAAPRVLIDCVACNASGTFGGHGGHGECFRCQGKGSQDDQDRRRNFGYDNNRSIH